MSGSAPVSRFFGRPQRAPVAIALLLSAPLFFASLLASSLAVERPRIVAEWKNHAFWAHASSTHPAVPGKTFHQLILGDPTPGNEALIWLWALLAVLLLVAAGFAFSTVRRFGAYLSCLAGVAGALLLRVNLDTWARHHAARFPFGVDNVPDSNTSNQIARGEWEANAKETIHSIGNVTMLLAAGIVLVYLISHWRRVRALAHALPAEADVGSVTLEASGDRGGLR
jgi:hypothetical protein